MKLHHKIRELIEQDPKAKQEVEGNHYFRKYLQRIGNQPHPWIGARREVYALLKQLDPEVILREFGLEELINSWSQTANDERGQILCKAISKHTEISENNLQRAKSTEWERYFEHKTVEIMRLAKYAQTFSNQIAILPYFKPILEQAVLPGIQLSEKRKMQYSIQTIVPRENWSNAWVGEKHLSIFLDTPLGIVLCYKGEQNAVAGVMAREKKIIIDQIQGVNLRKRVENKITEPTPARGLAVLDWKKFLVEYVAAWAEQEGMEEVIIRSGHNNQWTKKKWQDGEKKGQVHLELETALAIYDVTAKRLGFKQREDKNWYRPIPYVPEKGIVEKVKAIFAS